MQAWRTLGVCVLWLVLFSCYKQTEAKRKINMWRRIGRKGEHETTQGPQDNIHESIQAPQEIIQAPQEIIQVPQEIIQAPQEIIQAPEKSPLDENTEQSLDKSTDAVSKEVNERPRLGRKKQWWRNAQTYKNECFAIALVAICGIVYVKGRRRNYVIAHAFIGSVRELFQSQFLQSGAGMEDPPSDGRQILFRESCSDFLFYATGRKGCDGVLVRIDLIERQDLVMLVWGLLTPAQDTVTLEVALDDGDIEPMVFAVTRKRNVKKVLSEIPHLKDFAGAVEASELPEGLICLSENASLVEPLLPPVVLKTLGRTEGNLLQLMHFTDQNELPVVGQMEKPKKVLRFRFRLPASSRPEDMNGVAKIVEMALFYIDFLHRFKMSPGMKKKVIDKREVVAKQKLRMTRVERQERTKQLKEQKLQQERDEYELLSTAQKKKRDMRDEKRAKKALKGRKSKVTKTVLNATTQVLQVVVSTAVTDIVVDEY